ncbi:MAG: response regulator transcription factor [Desulfobacterota bacterium]|nr:response regulator transcription factor [Thermodesulfobacteriota bacterium]MDW8001396.1 response regulator transcription factor [Deltaproteobacteria bacterium]
MDELVFVLDDEADICELIRINFTKERYRVKTFTSAESFFYQIVKEIPDLIILDLMLPDMDGFEVCKKLKKSEKYSRIPVIMLTAKVDETDKIVGFEVGADDYVTKPFSIRELLARAKAVLRRAYSIKTSEVLELKNRLFVYPESYEAYLDGNRLELTTTEFRILELLMKKKGIVLTREAILDHLWGDEKVVVDRTIDVHIRHIREKLKDMGKCIKSVRGIGYKLEKD